MRLNKHSDSQKTLCRPQENLIHNHIQLCSICKKSYDEYNKYGIASTPMCIEFEARLRNHIEMCGYCSGANKRWNEDAIPTIPEMRQIVNELSKGQVPNPILLSKVRDYLMEKLELSSLEIGQLGNAVEKMVRGLKP